MPFWSRSKRRAKDPAPKVDQAQARGELTVASFPLESQQSASKPHITKPLEVSEAPQEFQQPSTGQPEDEEAVTQESLVVSPAINGVIPTEPKNLWEAAAEKLDKKAKEKLKALTGDEGERVKGASELINAFKPAVDELKKENEEATWRAGVEKALQVAKAIDTVGSAAVKFDKSGYAAAAWSMAIFGIKVALNAKDMRDSVLKSVDFLTGYMDRYEAYEQYRGPDIASGYDTAIVAFYKAVFLYVIDLREYLEGGGPKHAAAAILPPEDRDASKHKKSLEQADADVQKWIIIIVAQRSQGLKEINEELKRLRAEQETSSNTTCLGSLSFITMEDRYKSMHSAIEGTCSWLLMSKVYTTWNSCDKGLLWINGKPGSGKSTLLRYAYDNATAGPANKKPTIRLSFFCFGRGTDDLQKSPVGLFRSLLHQILKLAPEQGSDIVEFYKEKCNDYNGKEAMYEWHLKDLQRLFRDAIAKILQNYSVLLFVDALDECGEANAVALVKEFKSLLRQLSVPADSQLRICLSCRHYPIVDTKFPLEICLEHENAKDIDTYITARFEEDDELSPSTIPGLLKAGAGGVFMWARLVIDRALNDKRKGRTLKQIETQINATPEDLDKIYVALVQAVEDPALSLKMLEWISCSVKSLTLDELRWAMVIDVDAAHQLRSVGEYELKDDYISGNERMKVRLNNVTAGLAEVVVNKQGIQIVQFIHQTAKDYVTSNGLVVLDGNARQRRLGSSDLQPVPPPTAPSLIRDAHHRLARECLHYLGLREIVQLAEPIPDDPFAYMDYLDALQNAEDGWVFQFPFLEYALASWIKHCQESERGRDSSENPKDFVIYPSDTAVLYWKRLNETLRINSSIHLVEAGATMAHIAACNGLAATMEFFVQRVKQGDLSCNVKDHYGETPLHRAAYEGSYEMVSALLSLDGIDVNASTTTSMTPLLRAVEYAAQSGVVELLLDVPGIDVNVRDAEGESALCVAVYNMSSRCVRALVSAKDIDINAKYHPSRSTVLHISGREGPPGISQLLLDTGKVNLDATDKMGRTALQTYSPERNPTFPQQIE